ncbi:DNA (cytosine-5-)-methyltransferase [Paenibacillus odorifer]|uniref:DNA (cytosine-5-)-methyltransferase n=1 Tax=Paenibacillus odorifer TaxID=189426 RepID=A0ABX3GD04_9BACL|nr:DNA cytosine methyltransferase [Paenibacillus odorifer]OMC67690.1 DNA (cytosine-5-)-methyltransferase [Paenibacillus odorifer]OMD02501.1 DNA (cytosine-5-)-methyltransferase [Paenibacillus odorifer]
MSRPGWDWRLSDLASVPKHGRTVFSCFSCGGGSTMGYKLAGYTVLGNVEIDPQMMRIYRQNHNPRYPFLMPIQDFKALSDAELPPELFDLDILDGSPPCSVFSMAGDREDKWGGEHAFREGQAVQRLDDLFFDFLDVAEKLRPRVIVAENVRGMMVGKARGFVSLVLSRFRELGYKPQLFLLNSATMGVPQKRERLFFIASREDQDFPLLQLEFNEPPILYGDIRSGEGSPINPDSKTYTRWHKRRPPDLSMGHVTEREEGKMSNFNTILLKDQKVANTLASSSVFLRTDKPQHISDMDAIHMQTFPADYDFMDANVQYVCGMSVPPLMMESIAEQIQLQWFDLII